MLRPLKFQMATVKTPPAHCSKCRLTFESLVQYQAHLADIHKEILYHTCLHCNETFPSRVTLLNHWKEGSLCYQIKTGVIKAPYSCPLCYKNFIDEDKMKACLRACSTNVSKWIGTSTPVKSKPTTRIDPPVIVEVKSTLIPQVRTDIKKVVVDQSTQVGVGLKKNWIDSSAQTDKSKLEDQGTQAEGLSVILTDFATQTERLHPEDRGTQTQIVDDGDQLISQYIEKRLIRTGEGAFDLLEGYLDLFDWAWKSEPNSRIPTKQEFKDCITKTLGLPSSGFGWSGIQIGSVCPYCDCYLSGGVGSSKHPENCTKNPSALTKNQTPLPLLPTVQSTPTVEQKVVTLEHKCGTCGRVYDTKYTLARHRETSKHCLALRGKDLEPYVCPHCSKGYARKDSLVDHIKICPIRLVSNMPQHLPMTPLIVNVGLTVNRK